jgi:hypothetical protein
MISGGTRGTLDVSEAAELKALGLFGAEEAIDPQPTPAQWCNALARYIQDVSDAAKEASSYARGAAYSIPAVSETLAPFILPEPVDPLAEAVASVLAGFENHRHAESYAKAIRLKLATRGFKIVPEAE